MSTTFVETLTALGPPFALRLYCSKDFANVLLASLAEIAGLRAERFASCPSVDVGPRYSGGECRHPGGADHGVSVTTNDKPPLDAC
jgi:hypothetical protein